MCVVVRIAPVPRHGSQPKSCRKGQNFCPENGGHDEKYAEIDAENEKRYCLDESYYCPHTSLPSGDFCFGKLLSGLNVLILLIFGKTLMSTDIIHYVKDDSTGRIERVYSSGALKLFFEISLPIMAVVIGLWILITRYINARE